MRVQTKGAVLAVDADGRYVEGRVSFPVHRGRRLRRSESIRRMMRETRLAPADLIYPLFVVEGRNIRRPVASMPGIFNLSIDQAVEEARKAQGVGIPAVILFGVPGNKDSRGSGAYASGGILQRAIAEVKSVLPKLQVIADVCLCEYTDHGHCGLLENGEVQNDATLPLLAEMAVTCARAGADIVAPSDMMDGRVGAIRKALDEARLELVPILSYAAKYASAFYGPFREAAQSAPKVGDRRGYQMDPGNAREAVCEVLQDVEEGADVVMIKPALAYLDVIARVKEAVRVPVAAYNVSGEYAMVKAAASSGWADYGQLMMEALTSIKRAGADLIVTYHAPEAAKLLQESGG